MVRDFKKLIDKKLFLTPMLIMHHRGHFVVSADSNRKHFHGPFAFQPFLITTLSWQNFLPILQIFMEKT